MKRIALSGLLILTFVAYSFYIRISEPTANPAPVLVTKQTGGNTVTPVIPATVGEEEDDGGQVVAPTPKPAPTPAPVPVTPPPSTAGKYKNGTYAGVVADAFYGNVQVQVTISGGQISNVQFLDYPRDRNTSVRINSQAMPHLIQEAIQAQSANVNIISGATATSKAFIQSLASALTQAI